MKAGTKTSSVWVPDLSETTGLFLFIWGPFDLEITMLIRASLTTSVDPPLQFYKPHSPQADTSAVIRCLLRGVSQGGSLRHTFHPSACPLPFLSLPCYFKRTNSQGFVESGKNMGSELPDLPTNLISIVHWICDLEQIANSL